MSSPEQIGIPALDGLRWPLRGDVTGVGRALREGRTVDLDNQFGWPLPALPDNVVVEDPAIQQVEAPAARIVVTDMDPDLVLEAARVGSVVLTPPTLVVGIGCNRGVEVGELREHLGSVLRDHLLAPAAVAALVTLEGKADEPGLRALAEEIGVPLVTRSAEDLDRQSAPHPSGLVEQAVGTASVAEAGVLSVGATLVVPKHSAGSSTVAIGRRPPAEIGSPIEPEEAR